MEPDTGIPDIQLATEILDINRILRWIPDIELDTEMDTGHRTGY